MTNDHRADEALAGVIGDLNAFAMSAVVLACVERDIFRSVGNGSSRQSFVAAMTPNEGLGNAVVDVLVANGYVREEDGGLTAAAGLPVITVARSSLPAHTVVVARRAAGAQT